MTKKRRTGNLYQRGKTWWLKYMIEGRLIRQSLETTNREEAEEKQKEIMRPFMAADRVDAHAIMEKRLRDAVIERDLAEETAHPPLSVVDAWDAFIKSPKRPDSGPATLGAYALQWGSFVRWLTKEHPDMKQLREVTKETAEEYSMHLTSRGITPNTFNKHVRVCDLVFRILKDKAKIIENPFPGITRKHLTTQSHRELSTEELIRVCRSATGELRSMLAMGLYLGARLGDAVMMDWGCVDLIKRLIRYTPHKTARRSGRILTVPLHPVLLNIFNEIPPANRKGYIHPNMADLYRRRGACAVTNIIQAHFKKCGITTNRKGNGVRKVASASFHSLRHSAVSLLREAGAPLSVTMAIVGHSTLAIHDTYSHAGEAALKQAVAALPSVMGEPIPKTLPALPAATEQMIKADKVQALAERLNSKTWRIVRDELLTLATPKSFVITSKTKG